MKCVFRFSLQLLAEIFLTLTRIRQVIAINMERASCTVPVIIIRF